MAIFSGRTLLLLDKLGANMPVSNEDVQYMLDRYSVGFTASDITDIEYDYAKDTSESNSPYNPFRLLSSEVVCDGELIRVVKVITVIVKVEHEYYYELIGLADKEGKWHFNYDGFYPRRIFVQKYMLGVHQKFNYQRDGQAMSNDLYTELLEAVKKKGCPSLECLKQLSRNTLIEYTDGYYGGDDDLSMPYYSKQRLLLKLGEKFVWVMRHYYLFEKCYIYQYLQEVSEIHF